MATDAEFTVRVDGRCEFRYVCAPGDVVGRYLFWGGLGRWESETWVEFVPLARAARGFLDVGAFSGSYTLVACAANPDITCVAFEPVPRVYDALAANVRLNGWDDRATLRNAAVGTEVGTARFSVPDRPMPDTGHLEISRETADASGATWIDVPTTTVSAAVPDGFPIDLIKIDVENAEGPVVRGMADVIRRHRPTIIIELLPSGGYEEVADVLDPLGYDYFHLTADGRTAVRRPVPVPDDPYMNFLCVPRSPAG